MPSDFDQLIEMGFSENRAKKALRQTDNRGLQPALNWLIEHADDADVDDPLPAEEGVQEGDRTTKESSICEDSDMPTAKSMKCDECGKMFRSEAAVQMHAAKAGHSSFSESIEEVKPLTEEEKQKQLELIQEKLREKRQQKEAEEKERLREAELRRRNEGRNLRDVKEKFEEQERLREAEKSRKERAAEKEYRQMLKERIAKERAEKAGHPILPASVVPPQPSSSSITSSSNNSQCRLQIRLTNGSQLQHNFGAQEPLSAVRLFIELNRTDDATPFVLRTNYPPRAFTDEDMNKPLSALGLCPSAVIMLQKQAY